MERFGSRCGGQSIVSDAIRSGFACAKPVDIWNYGIMGSHGVSKGLTKKTDRRTTEPTTPRITKNRERGTHSMARLVPHRVLTLEQITSKNLAKAIAAAWQIFPYETHAEGFWPEVAFKMAIAQRNSRFAYYLARDSDKIVGITGHDPAEDGQPEMWLGWFGVLPAERRKGYGSKILLATCEIIGGFGISSLYIYSGDREDERAAHRLYLRTGFKQIGWGEVDGEPVLYFETKLPLASTEMGNTANERRCQMPAPLACSAFLVSSRGRSRRIAISSGRGRASQSSKRGRC
jgi:GNAT superfamily N-acetyltransferase